MDIDIAVIIGGKTGTMYEVTVLSGLSKDFYVLENSGGITKKTIKNFTKEGHKNNSKIIFIKNPEELNKYI
ncbi:hypothetical protein DRH27_01860 [Candidatus Falkowbacteria bacterium]|nr:MAG: hypothetical protein DRH27_01860 [Candidatus Falkowbacteria bacterium]